MPCKLSLFSKTCSAVESTAEAEADAWVERVTSTESAGRPVHLTAEACYKTAQSRRWAVCRVPR